MSRSPQVFETCSSSCLMSWSEVISWVTKSKGSWNVLQGLDHNEQCWGQEWMLTASLKLVEMFATMGPVLSMPDDHSCGVTMVDEDLVDSNESEQCDLCVLRPGTCAYQQRWRHGYNTHTTSYLLISTIHHLLPAIIVRVWVDEIVALLWTADIVNKSET